MSEGLCKWASLNLFGVDDQFPDSKAIGVVDEEKLLAAVIYSHYRETPDGKPHSVEMSIYTTDRRWATKRTLKEIFSYPFIQLGVERVQITTSVNNHQMNDLAPRLGFVKEGTHRKAHTTGEDAFSWSMLKNECRWINV